MSYNDLRFEDKFYGNYILKNKDGWDVYFIILFSEFDCRLMI